MSDKLKEIVKSPDHQATAAGVILGTVIAAEVDFPALLAGDTAEAGKAAGAVLVGVLGFLFNRGKKAKKKK